MFKIGDHIVYPMYGAGIITEIVEKDFLGEMRMYYNVSLPYCRMEGFLIAAWKPPSPWTTARSWGSGRLLTPDA